MFTSIWVGIEYHPGIGISMYCSFSSALAFGMVRIPPLFAGDFYMVSLSFSKIWGLKSCFINLAL